jgi:hypothetical protein
MAPRNRPVARTYHDKWLENAACRKVSAEVIDDIARRHGIVPDSFGVLEESEEIKDPHGKAFFLLPPVAGGDHAREVVLMTYVFNAGTGYGKAGTQSTDFPDTPYSAAEIRRIINRQSANDWSYSRDVRFVHRNGARLVATPNGILMGLGGNWIQRQFSQQGGTAWGDIFMLNIGGATDPAQQLRHIVRSGHAWCTDESGRARETNLDLDRVLHHEELHSEQWAAKGYPRMLRDYSWEIFRERVFGRINRLEADAGLSDGGYPADRA